MRLSHIIGIALAAGIALAGTAQANPKSICWDGEGWNGAGWYRCGVSRSIGLGWIGIGNGPEATIGQQKPTSDFAGVDYERPQPRFVSPQVVERYAPAPAPRLAPITSAPARAYAPGSVGDPSPRTPSVGRFSPPVF